MDLESFMESNPSHHHSLSFVDALPEEIQKQLVEARLKGAGWVVMDRWLRSEGYLGSTPGKLKNGINNLIERTRNES